MGGTALAAATSGTPAIAAARTRVLVIEDERALTDVLAYNLQREGYEAILAHDGQEGLRKAQTLLPDLILLDLMLPTMSGLDVCRELRAGERTRDIPIIMITAKAEETDQVVGFKMGADDYVTKPFSVKVLLERIKALQRRLESGAEPADVVEHLHVRIDRLRHRA
jgi:two-component system phosphate regulon response regulator PhoB